ncbi:MAG TPA: hypothetical protein VF610_07405 [Segetibacter sp.]|jgi:hypothetical protein
MGDNLEFDKDENFVVRESVLINLITGFIFLAILVGVLLTRNSEKNQNNGAFYLIYLFLAVGVAIYFIKVKRRNVILIINRNGIYYRNVLVTDWTNFINAYIGQDEYVVSNNSAGISDKFHVVVTFFEPLKGTNYIYKMAMSSSQNKSEYQVISDKEYFSDKKLSRDVN